MGRLRLATFPDNGNDGPVLLFLVVRTCYTVPGDGNKSGWGTIHVTLTMSWSYVDSASNLLEVLGAGCVWFAMSPSKVKSHDGTGWLRCTTVNVATLPNHAEKEREREPSYKKVD